jgi:hypothetical protein
MKNVARTIISVQSTIVQGDLVEVEVAGGNTVERIAWEVSGGFVYVCTQDAYERLARGEPAAQPIAFPLEDVRALA